MPERTKRWIILRRGGREALRVGILRWRSETPMIELYLQEVGPGETPGSKEFRQVTKRLELTVPEIKRLISHLHEALKILLVLSSPVDRKTGSRFTDQ